MKPTLLIVLLIVATPAAHAQTLLKTHVGLGYQEHFSTGLSLTVKNKNVLSLLYGSDFFYKTHDFSTVYFQYDRTIPSIRIGKFSSGVGIKLGHTVFTDQFYRWRVLTAIPVLSLNRQLNEKIEIVAEAGLAISRIESVTRISYGDIGHYKRYLPEGKIFMRYRILKFPHE